MPCPFCEAGRTTVLWYLKDFPLPTENLIPDRSVYLNIKSFVEEIGFLSRSFEIRAYDSETLIESEIEKLYDDEIFYVPDGEFLNLNPLSHFLFSSYICL